MIKTGIKDSYGREINYMRISITDRCNLRCRYCMPDGAEWIPMKEILTYEEITEVCQEAVKLGITRFKITGGEPLVRRGCPEVIRMIKNIPNLNTICGLNPKDKYAEEIGIWKRRYECDFFEQDSRD